MKDASVTLHEPNSPPPHQAPQMEAGGPMTGGVAHDFNNLLQVISGNLEIVMRLIARQPIADERLREQLLAAIASAQRSADSAKHLVDQKLGASGLQTGCADARPPESPTATA